ncbi:hypothetical protein MASR2M12_25360 [Bacteroidales bacterium]
MSSGRLIIIVLFLFAALLVLGIFLLDFSEERQPYDAVPLQSALVLELPQAGRFLDQLSTQTDFAASLNEMDFYARLRADLLSLDSLMSIASPDFSAGFAAMPVLCVLLETEHGFGFVNILKVGPHLHMYAIKEAVPRVFGSKKTVVDRKSGSYNTASLISRDAGQQVHFALSGGLLIAGTDRESFEKALLQLDNPEKITNQPGFISMKATSGSQADACLMFRTDALGSLLESNVLHDLRPPLGAALQAGKDWIVLDLNLKKDVVHFSGLMQANAGSMLHQLQQHQAGTVGLFNRMPYNTRLFLHLGMSELGSYLNNFADSSRLEALSSVAGYKLSEMQQAMGNEVVVGFTAGDPNQTAYLIAVLEQPGIMKQWLDRISEPIQGTGMKQVKNPLLQNLPETLWGKAFGVIDRMCYSIVDSCLFAANSPASLARVLQLDSRGRVLANQESFRNFSNQLATSAHLLLYNSFNDGPDLLNAFLDPRLGYQLNRNRLPLSRFGSIALQISAIQPLLYVHALVYFQPNNTDAGQLAWQLPLSAPLAIQPYVVDTGEEDRLAIVASDASNIIYYVRPEGKIVWKKQLHSPIVGKVNVVRMGKRKTSHLLFNTAEKIHLIDLNGNEAQGFPAKLKSKATNPVSYLVTDTDLKILVSCADRFTYCFGSDGRENALWQKPRSQEMVSRSIDQLSTGNQGYVVITDDQNGTLITDFNGKNRIPLRSNLKKSKNSQVYLNRTNSKGVLLTTNEQGKLLYISGIGAISSTDFGTYSPDHYFLYDDFDQNNAPDFLFLDKAKLVIFDRFKKTLFSFNFPNEITLPPYYLRLGNGTKLLCVTDELSGDIYLIDNRGKIFINSGIKGDVPFAVGSKNGVDELFFISGQGDRLVCYRPF